MNKLPELKHLLEFKNNRVIERFKQAHPKEAYRAEQLFTDMLRYLWLCKKHHQDTITNPEDTSLHFMPVMHEEMRTIDLMWHEFILVTRDYHDFCQQFFGQYIHHEPNMNEQLDYDEQLFIESLNLFLHYTYTQLGEETLRCWFAEYLPEAA